MVEDFFFCAAPIHLLTIFSLLSVENRAEEQHKQGAGREHECVRVRVQSVTPNSLREFLEAIRRPAVIGLFCFTSFFFF